LLFVAAAVGCTAVGRNEFTTASGTSGTGGAGGTGVAGSTGSGGSSMNVGGAFATVGTGVGGGPTCTVAATLVYVLSTDNEIYSFAPDQKVFTDLFSLNCATPTNDGLSWSPNSMAVDRNVVAWVNYVGTDTSDPLNPVDSAGVVFKVDINAQTCEATPTITLQDPSWYRLGMGFSTDTVGGTSETLYVTGTGTNQMANSPGLGKIDMTNNTVVPIGAFTGGAAVNLAGQSAELTGTGDGKLYGFFTTTPVYVAEITKATGATPAPVPMTGVETPDAWAFSFWGGDFYLYTDSQADMAMVPPITTNVTKYTPGGAVNPAYMQSIGFTIVGAGVSTCAPLTPPN
jgi:hypothetical protein